MSADITSKYVTDMINLPGNWGNRRTSSAYGASITGQRMHVGLSRKARGTGSIVIQHASEQFNFVLKGVLMGEIGGEPFRCPAGHVVHIPANTPHSCYADPNAEEDVIFFVCKDTACELHEATTPDGEYPGARVLPGFKLDENADHSRNFLS